MCSAQGSEDGTAPDSGKILGKLKRLVSVSSRQGDDCESKPIDTGTPEKLSDSGLLFETLVQRKQLPLKRQTRV